MSLKSRVERLEAQAVPLDAHDAVSEAPEGMNPNPHLQPGEPWREMTTAEWEHFHCQPFHAQPKGQT